MKDSSDKPYKNPHKSRRGPIRLWFAFVHSVEGLLHTIRSQPAFRTELCVASILLPWAIWVGQNWQGTAVLWIVTSLVLMSELLNTAIEAVVDKASPEWHAMAKAAKDAGSAAVCLTMFLCLATWVYALIKYYA